MVLYTASALVFILLVYIFIAERRAEKIVDADKKIKFSLKQGFEEFLALFFDLIKWSRIFCKKILNNS